MEGSQLEFKEALKIFNKEYGYISQNLDKFNGKEQEFFSCLENTTLFKKYSTLLNIMNCSVLDFIKSNEERYNFLKQAKDKDDLFAS